MADLPQWPGGTPAIGSSTSARAGGAAPALPAAPVKYLALRDETGARVYVPAYT